MREDAIDTPVYSNTNGIPLANDKSLHMEVGRDDIARRIVTVGSESRLRKMMQFFDQGCKVKETISTRGFVTVTGTCNGVDLSVVSIGMGLPMMDFFVREVCAVMPESLVIARFGTCGGLSQDVPPGSIVVATGGSALITRNYDYWNTHSQSLNHRSTATVESSVSATNKDFTRTNDGHSNNGFKRPYSEYSNDCIIGSEAKPYHMHKIAPADTQLSIMIKNELLRKMDGSMVVEGVNVSADSFYGSQGRIGDSFRDDNEGLISTTIASYPNVKTMEMETFQLFHLALACNQKIHTAAAAIVVANRCTGEVIKESLLDQAELEGGQAVMRAVCMLDL